MTIPHMRDLFDCEVGLFDHTMGIGVGVESIALGAKIIEKNFTLRRSDDGVDSAFSLEPAEMAQLVTETSRAWHALGRVSYCPTEAEKKSLVFHRSLYILKDFKAGESLTLENVRAIRPGVGLPANNLEILLGRKLVKDVDRGMAISWDLIG